MQIDKEGKIADPFLRGFEWGFQHLRTYQSMSAKWKNLDLKIIFKVDREDYNNLAQTTFGQGIIAALQSAWGK